jgi:alkylation response protein AidB-like acyl-CoA dehydrogenase
MHRIEMLNGSKHFCQEFFTDVRIPESERLGTVDDGWTIGTRWLFFERSFAMSPHVIQRSGTGDPSAVAGRDLLELARRVGRIDDPLARDMIGEVLADTLVGALTQRRIAQGMRSGYLTNQAAALSRLLAAVTSLRSTTVAYELAGSGGVVYDEADNEVGRRGQGYLSRQATSIGGGTTEMSRNAISERVLGMPRERDASRELPFREVPKGPSNR